MLPSGCSVSWERCHLQWRLWGKPSGCVVLTFLFIHGTGCSLLYRSRRRGLDECVRDSCSFFFLPFLPLLFFSKKRKCTSRINCGYIYFNVVLLIIWMLWISIYQLGTRWKFLLIGFYLLIMWVAIPKLTTVWNVMIREGRCGALISKNGSLSEAQGCQIGGVWYHFAERLRLLCLFLIL